jgi:hypothetical protein
MSGHESRYVFRWFSTTVAMITYAMILSAEGLQSQQSCVRRAIGVPPLGGPPNWWDTGQPPYAYTVRDPRWENALAMSYGSGTAEQALFRAVSDNAFLYLSWQMKVNQAFDAAGDVLHIVFGSVSGTPSGGAPDIRVEVWPLQSDFAVAFATSVSDAPVRVVVATRVTSQGAWTNIAPTPTWITQTARTWVDRGNNSWTFQMRVPLAAGGPGAGLPFSAGSNVRMWFQIDMMETGGNIVFYDWPRKVTSTPDPMSTLFYPWTLVIPDMPAGAAGCTVGMPCFWMTSKDEEPDFTAHAVPGASQLHLPANGPDPVTCSDVGVSLAYDDIGTRNAEASKINYRATTPRPINILFARPDNRSGTDIPIGRIRAHFRIANWGSMGTWEAITDQSLLWNDIPGTEAGVPNSAQINDGTKADITNLNFPWTVVDPFLANLLNGTMGEHQCMLVELETDLSLTFVNNSIYRNMDFVKVMSPYRRSARISVVALRPIQSDARTRDVFLYVETQNMPARRTQRSAGLTTPGGLTTHGRMPAGAPATAVGKLESVFPTYRVHAYHSTGRQINIGGRSVTVLRPQSSFGYWVSHDGELVGWRHHLGGDSLIKLAPNFYKIAVRSDSFATVVTTIEALEPPRSALSLHAGVTFPTGNFKNSYDRGVGVTFDLERRLNSRFSLAALFGYHRVDSSATTGSGPTPHLELYHASGSLEATVMTSGPLAFLIDGGGGMYWFKPGSSKSGAHAGFGLEYAPSLHVALGIWARGHNVFTRGSNTRFAAIQAGGRLMF